MSNGQLIESKPAFLAEIKAEDYMGEMRKHIKPPYIKIVQAMTGEPFKPPFVDGDIVVPPMNVKIGSNSEPFSFTPVYFFSTYVCFNPIQVKSLKSLRDFSFDPASEVAKKCEAFIKEKCPEAPEYFLKYNSILNFFVIVHGHGELQDTPITLSFKGGEFGTGRTLINLIEARKSPPFACRFRAASSRHKNTQFNWQGLDLQNDPSPWITDEVSFNKYKKLHDDMKEAVKTKNVDLEAQFSEADGDDANAADESKF